nr:glutathione S-transferase family protein [uncultured Dongia sp.]
MLRLLGRNTSGNVQKVIFLLEELGLPYAREDYGRQFNNTTDDAYLSLNPNGKVPTLVDDKVVIWESNTILRYLCNKQKNTELYPADPAARTQVERWMDWMLASLNPPYLGIFKEAKKAPGERAASWDADSKDLAAQLGILNKGIAGKKWAGGDSFSLADIALGPVVIRCLDFPVDLPELGNLAAWRKKLMERPAFKKAIGV